MKVTTGKEMFINRLVDLIAKEVRRRKVGKWVVLGNVVDVVNEMREDQDYHYVLRLKGGPYGN